MLREVWLLWESDKIVEGVHSISSCTGHCPVHDPSDHILRSSRLDYDSVVHCFVRVCWHNRVHMDPDEATYWANRAAKVSKNLKHISDINLYINANKKSWSFPCPDCGCGCCDITRKVFL